MRKNLAFYGSGLRIAKNIYIVDSALSSMNKQKRGLSDIVTNVLIILLVLVAVGIIWAFLQPVIQSGSRQIAGADACLTLSLQPQTCTLDAGTGNATVNYRRNAGDATVSELTFVFTDATGSSVVVSTTDSADFANELETRSVSGLDYGTITPIHVDIAATVQTTSGETRQCDVTGAPVDC